MCVFGIHMYMSHMHRGQQFTYFLISAMDGI